MNATESFTLDELLLALQGAEVEEDGEQAGIRMVELCEVTGRSVSALTQDLRKLIAAGRVECVKVWTTRIDGTRIRVPGYRVRHEHNSDHKSDHNSGTGRTAEGIPEVGGHVLGEKRLAGANRD